nr:phage tail tape measure protein [Consotaella salsifontis]
MTVSIKADTSAFDKAIGDLTNRANSFGSVMGSAFKGAVSGGKSFDTVLQQLSLRLSSLALNAALKPLDNLFGNLVQGILGNVGLSPGGGAGATVLPFAQGGVVASPSYFPAGNRIGLMGEAGAEAILPLKRGADGSLGVAAASGGQAAPSIIFNVTATDAASFKRSEAQIQTMLARAVSRGRRGL